MRSYRLSLIAATLLLLPVATASAAAVFNFENMEIDPGTSGTLTIYAQADAATQLVGVNLDIQVSPAAGLTFTGLSSAPAELEVAGLDTTNAAAGSYFLSANDFTLFGQATLPAIGTGLTPLFVIGYSVASDAAGAFDITTSVDYYDATDGGSATGGVATITVAPEPASLALLGLGSLLIVRRKRAA
jgi:hypothetical protein